MTDIAVVDYGMGNLRSVVKALEHVAPRARVVVTSDPLRVKRAGRIVFPGQGAMPDCMREMDALGLRDAVLDAAATKPFLGLCIGLQMLFDFSEEGGVPGLGVLRGRVLRFPKAGEALDCAQFKVPHMGWNQVYQSMSHPLWDAIPDGARFYFVHSYYVKESQPHLVAGQTHYPFAFSSAVAKENIFAVQFHPEKSQAAGLALLSNFVTWKL
jgi:imidazole glycerol-phosphate synthase subunit HisH